MQLTDDEVAALVLREISQAQGYESDVLSSKRQTALDFYYGIKPGPPAAAGRSAVVSMDVADGLHALLAELSPVLKSSIVEFPPDGQADVVNAEMESTSVRQVLERSNGYGELASVIPDALLLGGGWLYANVEEVEKTEVQSFPPETPLEAFAPLEGEEDNGIEAGYGQDGNVEVKHTTKVKRLEFEAVPPEQMIFSSEPGIGAGDVGKLRLVGRKRQYTQAALVDLGIDIEKVRAIPDSAPGVDMGVTAREGEFANTEFASVQDANRLKDVYCVYIRLDRTGAGKEVELRHIWVGGTELLLDEAAEVTPYICGCAIPVPHRVQGLGLGDLLQSIQEGKTETLRNFLDNLVVLNASKLGVLEGAVNMDDVLNGRLNGAIRMQLQGAIFPIPATDIGPQAMAGLDYLDKVRSQRIGAAMDATDIQAQLMGASATAAAGQLAKVELMSGWFAENLAQTLLKPLYLLCHKLQRASKTPIMAKRQGQWVQVDPGQWKPREIAQVTMGLTTTQRITRINALTSVLGQQQNLIQQGQNGVMTDPARVYNAMCDWLRASDLPDPDQYFIDPSSPEAQAAAKRNQESQAQQQAAAARQASQVQQQTFDFELVKQHRELQYKYWADQLDAAIKEAELVSAGTTAVIQSGQASALQTMQERKAILQQILQGAMTAPADNDAEQPGAGVDDAAA